MTRARHTIDLDPNGSEAEQAAATAYRQAIYEHVHSAHGSLTLTALALALGMRRERLYRVLGVLGMRESIADLMKWKRGENAGPEYEGEWREKKAKISEKIT